MDGGRDQRRPAPGPEPAAPRGAARCCGRSTPGRTRNVLATAAQLRDEAQVLEQAVEEALRRTGAGGVPPAVDAARLAAEPPPVRRLVLRRLAEAAAGATVALRPEDARAIERLAERGGSGTVDLGGGLQRDRRVRDRPLRRGPADGAAPAPGRPGDPGQVPFRRVGGRLGARSGGPGRRPRLGRRAAARRGPARATRSPCGRGVTATGCSRSAWTGRSRCRTCSATARCRARCGALCRWSSPDGEIAWVAGVAVSERFQRRAPDTRATVRLAPSRSPTPRLPTASDADACSLRARRRDGGRGGRRSSAASRSSEREITRDYAGRELFMMGVLKGAVFFVADLMRNIDVPCELDFMAVSSYGSMTDSSGVVRILKDLDSSIEGKDVLIVEDIVDSGLTLNYLLRNLRSPQPALARGLRAAGEAGPAQDRAADPLRRLRDPEPLRGRLRPRPRSALPQPALRRRARRGVGVAATDCTLSATPLAAGPAATPPEGSDPGSRPAPCDADS